MKGKAKGGDAVKEYKVVDLSYSQDARQHLKDVRCYHELDGWHLLSVVHLEASGRWLYYLEREAQPAPQGGVTATAVGSEQGLPGPVRRVEGDSSGEVVTAGSDVTAEGVTYVWPNGARYGRLQDAVEQFRQQAGWLEGYLFIVGEHFEDEGGGGTGPITAQAALSYLDSVPGVANDVRAALEEMERLAAELRGALACEESGEVATPGVTDAKAEERLYSEREAAERLGVSRITLLRARKAGRIGFYQIGARVLFSETEHLRPFLDGCHQKPGARQEGPAEAVAGPS